MLKIKEIICRYYSNFIGSNISSLNKKISFVCNSERDIVLKGYGCKISIYILVIKDKVVISYSPKYKEYINKIKGENFPLKKILDDFQFKHNILFYLQEEKICKFGFAKKLEINNYKDYEEFFIEAYSSSNIDWLYDYYKNNISNEFIYGYYVNNKLVTVVDGPDMPYMSGVVQHTGVYTLKEYRNRNYGKYTLALATNNLLKNNICSNYECSFDNKASIALAESIGYVKFGESYCLEE